MTQETFEPKESVPTTDPTTAVSNFAVYMGVRTLFALMLFPMEMAVKFNPYLTFLRSR